MKWFEIGIATTSEGADIMSELLFEAGVKGVVTEDKEDLIRFIKEGEGFDYTEAELADRYDSAVKVKGYLPDDSNINAHIDDINARVAWLLVQDLGVNISPGTVLVTEIYEQDWAHSWKEYFKPLKVGEIIVVKPSWESYTSNSGEIVIDMDPGMAFGTGTHETTILCISALERYVIPASSVLDIGCGTGILGIASILLGANRAVLIDIDSQAISVAKTNSIQNGTFEKMEFIIGDLVDKAAGRYDLVVANISSKAIEKLIPQCIGFLAGGGNLVLSGILKENEEGILTIMNRNEISLVESCSMGDWVCIVGQYA